MIHSIGNNLKHSAYMRYGEVIIGWKWCHFLRCVYKKRAGYIDASSFFEMPLPRNFILPYTGGIFERKYYLKIWSIVCISSGVKMTSNVFRLANTCSARLAPGMTASISSRVRYQANTR